VDVFIAWVDGCEGMQTRRVYVCVCVRVATLQ